MKAAPPDNALFYDHFARTYAELYGILDATEAVRQWILLLRSLAPDSLPTHDEHPTLLDVGCGPGWHLAPWAEAGYAATGLDSSHQMLAIARAGLDQAGLTRVSLIHANLLNVRPFPVDTGHFDLFVSHTNFPQLFSSRQLRRVAAALASIAHPRSRWMLDLSNPSLASPKRVEEHFTDTNGIDWTATGTHRAARREYHIEWNGDGRPFGVEHYWMHDVGQVDTILGASGWIPAERRSWHPHHPDRPWRGATLASKRFVILYERRPKGRSR